ncbi:hypothetical protein D0384_08510 [Staphylococcus epidermidis]|nr:hypothetical protein [Staphylococcus epidermidis]
MLPPFFCIQLISLNVSNFIVSKKINNSNYRIALTFLMFLHSSINQCYNMVNKNSSVNTPIPSLLQ